MLETDETISENEVAPGSGEPLDFSPNTLALPIFGIKSAVRSEEHTSELQSH